MSLHILSPKPYVVYVGCSKGTRHDLHHKHLQLIRIDILTFTEQQIPTQPIHTLRKLLHNRYILYVNKNWLTSLQWQEGLW